MLLSGGKVIVQYFRGSFMRVTFKTKQNSNKYGQTKFPFVLNRKWLKKNKKIKPIQILSWKLTQIHIQVGFTLLIFLSIFENSMFTRIKIKIHLHTRALVWLRNWNKYLFEESALAQFTKYRLFWARFILKFTHILTFTYVVYSCVYVPTYVYVSLLLFI